MFRGLLLALVLSGPAYGSGGGPYTLESSLVGPVESVAGPETDGPGGTRFHSGFLRAYSIVQVAALQPGSRGGSFSGLSLAVPLGESVGVDFGIGVATRSLVLATTVYLVYDHLGTHFDQPVPFEFMFDTATGHGSFMPPGGWDGGATYRIEIGPGAVDTSGNPLAGALTARFQATLDFAEENVIRSAVDESASVRIPSGTLTGTGYVVFNEQPLTNPDKADPSQIANANAGARADLGPQSAPLKIVELNAYDSGGVRMAAAGFARRPVLSLPYADPDGDGRVVGAQSVRASDLALWTLDETRGLWLRVPGSTVDIAGRTVSAPLPHFSVYAVIPMVDTNVSQAYAFPVPWRPNGGDAARYGTNGGGITFANLPQVGRIRIYSLSGGLVREHALDGSLTWVWDGANMSGQNAASGTYLWAIDAGGNRKTGKLMVIR